jgi:hypothetical protein
MISFFLLRSAQPEKQDSQNSLHFTDGQTKVLLSQCDTGLNWDLKVGIELKRNNWGKGRKRYGIWDEGRWMGRIREEDPALKA